MDSQAKAEQLGQREPQSHMLRVASNLVFSPKPLEKMRQILRAHIMGGILNENNTLVARLLDPYFDHSSLWRVFDCIGEEIVQDQTQEA